MVVSGLERAVIAATTDQYFESAAFLSLIKEDGEFKAEPAEVNLADGGIIQSCMNYEFTLTALESDKFSIIRGFANNTTPVYVWAYGNGGSLVFTKASYITYTENISGKSGELVSLTVKVKSVGSLTDRIQYRRNLLPDRISRGSSVADLTSTGSTVTSATKNASFTAATSPVIKQVQSVAGTAGHIYSAESPVAPGWIIPVFEGMVLSVYVKSYLYNQTSSYWVDFGLIELVGSMTNASNVIEISDAGYVLTQESLAAITAGSTAAKLYVELRNTGGTATVELDDIMIVYGSTPPDNYEVIS